MWTLFSLYQVGKYYLKNYSSLPACVIFLFLLSSQFQEVGRNGYNFISLSMSVWTHVGYQLYFGVVVLLANAFQLVVSTYIPMSLSFLVFSGPIISVPSDPSLQWIWWTVVLWYMYKYFWYSQTIDLCGFVYALQQWCPWPHKTWCSTPSSLWSSTSSGVESGVE